MRDENKQIKILNNKIFFTVSLPERYISFARTILFFFPTGGAAAPPQRPRPVRWWISSFVDSLLQPIAKSQKSYLKDRTDFINFIEKTWVVENVILVSMDVTSLYTNIPQEEAITIICKAYETFYQSKTSNTQPIPRRYTQTNPKGEFVPICWKKLSPSTRYSYGNKNGSCIC